MSRYMHTYKTYTGKYIGTALDQKNLNCT